MYLQEFQGGHQGFWKVPLNRPPIRVLIYVGSGVENGGFCLGVEDCCYCYFIAIDFFAYLFETGLVDGSLWEYVSFFFFFASKSCADT